MAGITLADAQTALAAWLAAEIKVTAGQEYSIGTRRLVRADLSMIGERVKYWDAKVKELSSGTAGIRIRGGTPT